MINKIRWSDFPKNEEMTVILIDPTNEVRIITIPKKGAYITFNAYFEVLGISRQFELTLPYGAFDRFVRSLLPKYKDCEGKNVKVKLYKTNHRRLEIKGWKVLK